MTEWTDPVAMDLPSKRVWVCPECGRAGMPGQCTDCNPVEPDKWPERVPYVPAADLASAREEVRRLRTAFQRCERSLGWDGNTDRVSFPYRVWEQARAALDTTGEGGDDG